LSLGFNSVTHVDASHFRNLKWWLTIKRRLVHFKDGSQDNE